MQTATRCFGPIKLLYLISLVFLPLIMSFSPSLLDRITIVAIDDLQLRKAGDDYLLDAVIVINNATQKTLKLKKCEFTLGFALSTGADIALGKALKDDILLPSKGEPTGTDTKVRLALNLGQDVQPVYQQIMTTGEILALLPQSNPKINLHLQALFDLGIQAGQTWNYQNGVEIDWIVTPETQRATLVSVVQALGLAVEGKDITLAIPKTTIYFLLESSTLDETAKAVLQQWSQTHQQGADGSILHVEGHTHDLGNAARNQQVSEERAQVVYQYLTETLSVRWEPMMVKGLSNQLPVATSNDEASQAKNNRVELYLTYE
jgi:outer membrane protein OmpA-like peptidoglycan-associated protein